MAIPFTPDDVASGFNLSKLNSNFDKVETALSDALSRSGNGPNQMEADIDLNNNDLLNVNQTKTNELFINGALVTPDALQTIPSSVMLKGTYDPASIQQDVYDRKWQGDFNTEAQFVATNIPAIVQFITTAGYNAVGDGGGHIKKRISTPSPVKAWHKQSADGSWWEIADQNLSVKMFGAAIDGVTNDATAINNALEYGALIGRDVFQPVGTSIVDSTIILNDGVKWIGADMYNTIVKRAVGHSGALVKTVNFDALTGTSDAFVSTVPESIRIENITFDGNYQNEGRTAYNQATGEGLRLFCRKLQLIARVFNTPGVGVWAECPGGNGPSPFQPGFSREAKVNIYVHQTQYEGVVWKGPPDVKIDWILQADAGSRITASEGAGKVSSPTYGSVNGSQTFGVVFDARGAEVGTIHAFGNLGGGGIHWLNGGRINADLLMAESCNFGGIRINGAASGIISKLDVHRSGGFSGDSTADFIYDGTGNNNYGVEIGVCSLYRQNAANTGSRNFLEIPGDFLDIGLLKIDGGSTATAGHGVYIDNDTATWVTIRGGEIARCKGVAPDALASSAVYRKTTGNGSIFKINTAVRDCDVAFRSTGTPSIETINMEFFLNAGQLAFAGDVRTQLCQSWDIKGTINGVAKSSKFVGLSAAFNSNSGSLQSQTVAHNLIFAPPFGRYHAGNIVDSPTSMTAGRIGFINIVSVDATNITVEFQMQTVNGVDTAPRVSLFAEI